MTEAGASLDFAYRHCETLVRERDPDRYFANLFAPAGKRPHLFALHAFSAEIAHVQEVTREPLTGEIRLQWWRDALDDPEKGRANPVAAALQSTIRAFGLPRSAFHNLIDARVFDIYSEPMPDMHELEGYCGETCSVLFQMAAMILAGETVDVSEAAGHGGVAYAVTGLIRAFPWHVRRGKLFVPQDMFVKHGADIEKVLEGADGEAVRMMLLELRGKALDHLGRAEAALVNVLPAAKAVFLPLILVQPYLRLMDAADYKPFEAVLDRAQWRKQWALWRAARKMV